MKELANAAKFTKMISLLTALLFISSINAKVENDESNVKSVTSKSSDLSEKITRHPSAANAPADIWNLVDEDYVSDHTYDTTGIQDTITMNGRITFDQNVIFRAESGKTLNINVGQANTGGQVVLRPLISTDVAPKYTHLIFDAEEDSTINFTVFSDLIFTGQNSNAALIPGGDTTNYENTELTVTFKGKGQVKFNIANGKFIRMESMVEQADDSYITDTSIGAKGVASYIAMDQNKNDVVGLGKNKIVFKRKDYPNGGQNDTGFEIGLNSFMTGVSVNYTGLDATTNPTHTALIESGDFESYAAIAFDVSNQQSGKMIFRIKGESTNNTYRDGAFSLYGKFIETSAQDGTPGSYTGAIGAGAQAYTVYDDIRLYTNFSQAAGSKMFLRVIDKTAYDADLNSYQTYLNPTDGKEVGFFSDVSVPLTTRRGLFIENSNRSLPAYASNAWGDSGWYFQDIYNNGAGLGNSPIQPGFTLGINGEIEVAHNTFVDYEAQSPNINFVPAAVGLVTLNDLLTDAGITDPTTIFKQRNPSALLVDGLGSVLVDENIVPTPGDPSDDTDQILFEAHIEPGLFRRATLTLNGNASMICRAPIIRDGGNNIVAGTYDGYRLPVVGETLGDGIIVMDVEDLFLVRSVADDFSPSGGLEHVHGAHTGSSYDAKGIFRLGSLTRTIEDKEGILDTVTESLKNGTRYGDIVSSQAGNEYIYSSLRPLNIGSSYTRYDRASILANASIDFVNLNFYHDDVSRDIRPDVKTSPPAILGGEKANYENVVLGFAQGDILFWRIYNSKIHCFESLCVSGVRVVLRELPIEHSLLSVPAVEQNKSEIIMFNHGRTLDRELKGFGRIFLLGSNLNEFADGSSSSLLQNSYINVFRHTGGPVGTVGTAVNLPVQLSLKTASQYLQYNSELDTATSLTNEGVNAVQMFFMGNNSNIEVGWISTEGVARDADEVTVYPWDHLKDSVVLDGGTGGIPSVNRFDINATREIPATLSLAGNLIYLGGVGPNGEKSPTQISSLGLGRVIYMGHGSKIEITRALVEDTENPGTFLPTGTPFIGFADATIAMRVWKQSEPGLNTQIDLPFDQMNLASTIKPYDMDISNLTVDGDATDAHLRLSALTGPQLGTRVSVHWPDVKGRSDVPINRSGLNYLSPAHGFSNSFATRAIDVTTVPFTMPTSGLLLMAQGDLLDQLLVSGATVSDPFLLYLTGDVSGVAHLHEIVGEDSSTLVPGEGNFGRIFMDNGARIGLGSRDYNENSVKAWNLIGQGHVTLVPNGDCQIDVNSNLIVADAQPIIPTENFGSDDDVTEAPLQIRPTHRITFFSHDTREIRVPAGKELDLSAFGSHTNVDGDLGRQQIAFGGNVKLIFEPGSALRFPSLADSAQAPILYMNENSELIFEAIQDMENKYSDRANEVRWDGVDDVARSKISIFGNGQIWINKTSKMIINDNALVAIESDDQTPNTDISISLQREGQLLIGDRNILGGSLQVGNPKFDTAGAALTVAGTPTIDFTLRLNSDSCRVHLGRNAFLGFGAGVVDRFEGEPNGDDNAFGAWTVQPLQNVQNIYLKLIKGTVNHNQIFDGNSSESSVMAIGPISGGQYRFEFGPSEAHLRGGGNIVFVGDVTLADANDTLKLNIGSTAVALTGNAATDHGKYSIINSTATLAQRQSLTSQAAGTVFYTGTTTADISANFGEPTFALGSYGFRGNQSDAYTYLAYQDFKQQSPNAFLPLSVSGADNRIGYVNDGVITRTTNLSLVGGITISEVEGVKSGSLKSATVDNNNNPSANTLPSDN